MVRRARGPREPWWEREDGAAYRELCRALAQDEITVEEFEAQVGHLTAAAQERSIYRDAFAPLALADRPAQSLSPPPSTPAPTGDRSPIASTPLTRPVRSRLPAPPPSRVPSGESADQYFERLGREADREKARATGRGFISGLVLDDSGGLWARREELRSARSKHEVNIPVSVMRDGTLSVTPTQAPPAPVGSAGAPERFGNREWVAVRLRTPAQLGAARADEYEHSARADAPRQAPRSGERATRPASAEHREAVERELDREAAQLCPRSAQNRPAPLSPAEPGPTHGTSARPGQEQPDEQGSVMGAQQVLAHLRQLAALHASGIISGGPVERLAELLDRHDRGILSPRELWEQSAMDQDWIDRYSEQLKLFSTQRGDPASGPWLAEHATGPIVQGILQESVSGMLAEFEHGRWDEARLFVGIVAVLAGFGVPGESAGARIGQLLNDHLSGGLVRDQACELIAAELGQALQRGAAARSRRIPAQVKRAVWERDGGRCVECGSARDIHYDHDVPFSKGGSSTAENIRLLCASCNLKKGARIA